MTQEFLEELVRDKLCDQVTSLSRDLSVHDDLQLAGVQSLDLIVLLSYLEQRLNITLSEMFVVKGYTIGSIAARVAEELHVESHTAMPRTAE